MESAVSQRKRKNKCAKKKKNNKINHNEINKPGTQNKQENDCKSKGYHKRWLSWFQTPGSATHLKSEAELKRL